MHVRELVERWTRSKSANCAMRDAVIRFGGYSCSVAWCYPCTGWFFSARLWFTGRWICDGSLHSLLGPSFILHFFVVVPCSSLITPKENFYVPDRLRACMLASSSIRKFFAGSFPLCTGSKHFSEDLTTESPPPGFVTGHDPLAGRQYMDA
mmetsp:Transcript_2250/g.3857  ORF Transcript_2250/g.3857 Transcript_2250/m.3857 type:complete len:151 (+) Transcript_2250:614-1066(+)